MSLNERIATLKAALPTIDDATVLRMLYAQDNTTAPAAPPPPPRPSGSKIQFTVPTFNWEAKDLWEEWEMFDSAVTKAFMMPGYEYTEAQKITIIQIWMGHRVDEIADSWEARQHCNT